MALVPFPCVTNALRLQRFRLKGKPLKQTHPPPFTEVDATLSLY